MNAAPASALHVADTGPTNAPTVVLLHSIATHGALWAPQVPVWAAQLRVLSVDLPGHGESPVDSRLATLEDYARCIVRWLDAHDVQRCAIVGLSLGAMIGQAFALDYPQRLRALVLANTSALTPPPMHDAWQARKAAALAEGMEPQVTGTLERWFPAEFASRSPLTVAWVADMIRRTDPVGYRCAIEAIQAMSTYERLPSIRCPVMVVSGGRDVATTPAIMRPLAERIPGARFVSLEQAGHISNLVQPIEFTECVGAFLRETASA